MSEKTIHHIWHPETGITDIGTDSGGVGASEVPGIRAVWAEQQEQLKGTTQLAQFTKRLGREWAIETGIIEDLYDIDRGVTQTLIEHGFQSELLSHGSTNKPRDYVIQLLRDQENALEGVFAFVKAERNLSVSYIKELQATLLRSQDTTEGQDSLGRRVDVPVIKGDWKQQPNYPERGGKVYAYCPPEQTASEMDRLVEMHTGHVKQGLPPDVQAAWLHHRFTQIHPFQDGNGRVARAIASMVLIKNGLFPLVVTRDDRSRYIESLEAADEGRLKPLVDIIAKLQIRQFRKASVIAEAILLEETGMDAARDSLLRAADQAAAKRREDIERVFSLAEMLGKEIRTCFDENKAVVETALKQVANGDAGVLVHQSEPGKTEHYYRYQIVENAKNNLGYFADMKEYRAWFALSMYWNSHRHAKLVFAIHGVGRPFNGSLICAPFMEFKDSDEENGAQTRLVPVAEEGFVFFFNEEQEQLLSRFRPWRDDVLKVALKEIENNLW